MTQTPVKWKHLQYEYLINFLKTVCDLINSINHTEHFEYCGYYSKSNLHIEEGHIYPEDNKIV